MIKFDVKNRFTGEIQFTAEIDCSASASLSIKRGLALKWANLEGADLKGADLKWADLKGADLKGADLKGADLKGADLEVPKIENIHQKIYKAASEKGALDMGNWHTCDTTHCRAGWAVHLAGKKGYELEKEVGPCLAGVLIYRESDPDLKGVPNFYADNEDALADMKRLAEEEKRVSPL